MTATMPSDVSLGELWRGQLELQRGLDGLASKLDSLPERLAADLDARSQERVDAYRREHEREHEAHTRVHETHAQEHAAHTEAHKTIDLRHDQLKASVDLLWRIVWGVIGFVFVAIGTAVLSLVIVKQGAGK